MEILNLDQNTLLLYNNLDKVISKNKRFTLHYNIYDSVILESNSLNNLDENDLSLFYELSDKVEKRVLTYDEITNSYVLYHIAQKGIIPLLDDLKLKIYDSTYINLNNKEKL